MKNQNKHSTYSNTTTYTIDCNEKEYLFIQESQIKNAGKGLFPAIKLFKDEVISLFKGEILTTKQIRVRSDNGEDSYFINLVDGGVMDSMNVECFAKYANDAQGLVKTNFKNNAKITLDEHDNVCLVALKDIKVNEEIFCGYGKAYWIKFKN